MSGSMAMAFEFSVADSVTRAPRIALNAGFVADLGCAQANHLWNDNFETDFTALLYRNMLRTFAAATFVTPAYGIGPLINSINPYLDLTALVLTNRADPDRAHALRTHDHTALWIHADTQVSTSTGLVYVDAEADRATLAPPDSLPPAAEVSQVLHVSRVSDSILNALWWFAGAAGYLNRPHVFSVLDANITVHVSFSNLQYQIPQVQHLILESTTHVRRVYCLPCTASHVIGQI